MGEKKTRYTSHHTEKKKPSYRKLIKDIDKSDTYNRTKQLKKCVTKTQSTWCIVYDVYMNKRGLLGWKRKVGENLCEEKTVHGAGK